MKCTTDCRTCETADDRARDSTTPYQSECGQRPVVDGDGGKGKMRAVGWLLFTAQAFKGVPESNTERPPGVT